MLIYPDKSAHCHFNASSVCTHTHPSTPKSDTCKGTQWKHSAGALAEFVCCSCMLHLKTFSETLFLTVENECVFKLSLQKLNHFFFLLFLFSLEINTKKPVWSRGISRWERQGSGCSLAGAPGAPFAHSTCTWKHLLNKSRCHRGGDDSRPC